MKLVIDVETNGFLDKLNKIHCLVCKDIETNKIYSYNPKNIKEGLQLIQNAKTLIGHNILSFDLPALDKVYGFKFSGEIVDTLLLSRLIWTNRIEQDCKLDAYPPKLIGKHSIESYGFRFGLLKGNFKDTQSFEEWSQEMQDYCERDVEITTKLYKLIENQNYSKEAIELEHKFAYWIKKQEDYGVNFDVTASEWLYQSLTKRRLELEQKLALTFPSWERFDRTVRPKRDNKTLGYKKGVPVKKYITEVFNPNSREHIANRLQSLLGWKPKQFTATGKVEVNEKILDELPYPEAKLLSEHFLIQKRISQLAEGEQAFLKLTRDNKIYGKIISNGAITGRCTHYSPNLAQVPSKDSLYGSEFRKLFIAPADMVMCGIDFSGLELRVLSHYLYNFDNGQFQKKLLEDDVHTANQLALGLSSRSQAKTFIYAFIYGAGSKRISEIINVSVAEAERIRKRFEEVLPALKTLIDVARNKFKNLGFIKGLDGRKLICRAEYSVLNTLIQSAGALLVKQGTIIINNNLIRDGFVFGKDYAMVLHIHDEMQFVVSKEKIEQFTNIAALTFEQTRKHFNFRCPLAGEIKLGSNWSETH